VNSTSIHLQIAALYAQHLPSHSSFPNTLPPQVVSGIESHLRSRTENAITKLVDADAYAHMLRTWMQQPEHFLIFCGVLARGAAIDAAHRVHNFEPTSDAQILVEMEDNFAQLGVKFPASVDQALLAQILNIVNTYLHTTTPLRMGLTPRSVRTPWLLSPES
jgi:hypothetical protein